MTSGSDNEDIETGDSLVSPTLMSGEHGGWSIHSDDPQLPVPSALLGRSL
jgi:hypothetical protein